MRTAGSDSSARTRLLISAGCGLLAGLVAAVAGPWWLIPLAFWDGTAIVFLGWTWRVLRVLGPGDTARHAQREDPSRGAADTLLIGASLTSLLAVGLVLVRAGKMHGLEKGLLVGSAAASIVLGWAIVHTVYTLRYARLYYAQPRSAVDFNEDEAPVYSDFAYLSLTIGMTFQVSDTDLQTKGIRRAALRHAVLSYAFGALIIATTVNLIAGLGK